MARPISLRAGQEIQPLPEVQLDVEGIGVKPITFWTPAKGLDYASRKTRITPEYLAENLNMYLDKGTLRSRAGTSEVGSAASDPIMAVVNFVTGLGIGFLLRFTTTKLQQWDGAGWDDVGTAIFTGDTSNYFTYTAFNDTLLFSNGVDGLWEYAPLTGSLTLIPGGPNALHLTTWAERVIASGADGLPYRTRWSINRNSRDWDGLGSGFEDLLSTPGGIVDQVMGVYPITEDYALMVRSHSIWQVTRSGDPDAPFRFSRLHSQLGSLSRHSIVVIPGGIVMLGGDEIWVVSDSGVQPIGTRLRDRLFLETTELQTAKGIYRPRQRDYWLLPQTGDLLYRYSFQDQGWTRHRYPFNIRWMEQSIFHYGGVTWDEMVGTWDEQTANWDELLGEARAEAFYFAAAENETEDSRVIKEDTAATTDGFIAEDKSAQGILVETGIVLSATPLEKTELIEAQLEYEEGISGHATTWNFSTDGGTVWNSYSAKTIPQTSGRPRIVRAIKTYEREMFQFQITSTALGQLQIMSLTLFVVQGAKIAP